MTDNNDLLVRREDGVLVLTFNRPEHRNALTQEMQARLGEELAAAELDREVGCMLLTGAGGAFCAGGDVKNMARGHAAGAADRSAAAHGSAAPVAAAHLAAPVRDGQAYACRLARRRGRCRPLDGACLRHAHRRRDGDHEHRLREDRPVRGLRRHLSADPARRTGQGTRALPAGRPHRHDRGVPNSAW